MRWIKRIFSHRARYDEIAEGIRQHLEERTEDLVQEGLSREEAARRASREFGNVTLIEERSREIWEWPGVESAWRDSKLAGRQLRRNAGFTITVVLTLALSIGINTAIFSVVNALLLKDLPYPQPERLGTMFAQTTGSDSSDGRRSIDGEQWQMLRDEAPSVIAAVSALHTSGVKLQTGSHAQYVHEGRVPAQYFNLLNLQPLAGRNSIETRISHMAPKQPFLAMRYGAQFSTETATLSAKLFC